MKGLPQKTHVRSLLLLTPLSQLAEIVRFLKAKSKVVRLKNRLKDPYFTGLGEIGMNVAIPLPSNSFLGGNSKKKFHVTEVKVALAQIKELEEEAKAPYDFFSGNAYQLYLGATVEKFFGGGNGGGDDRAVEEEGEGGGKNEEEEEEDKVRRRVYRMSKLRRKYFHM